MNSLIVPDHRVKNSNAIQEILRLGNVNEEQIKRKYPHLMVLMSDVHSAMLHISSGTIDAQPVPMFLVFQAHSHYLAAVRVATGGNLTAIFPLLRAILESISFALIAEVNQVNAEIWMNRDKNGNTKKKCVNLFKFSNGLTRLRDLDSELADQYAYCYEASISFGAHPNQKGIFSHASFERITENDILLNLPHIHPATSEAIFEALDAVIRFGCLLVAGTRYALPNHPAAKEAYLLAESIWNDMNVFADAVRT